MTAATLTGLVFVALSINLNRIMAIPGLPGRAGGSILQFPEVFLVSTAGLIPRQTEGMFGGEVLVIGLLPWLAQVIGQVNYMRRRHGHPSWFGYMAVLSQLRHHSLPGGGNRSSDWSARREVLWLMLGLVCSFVAGIVSGWVLLVEILLAAGSPGQSLRSP
jgi:modulator of FtsH protease